MAKLTSFIVLCCTILTFAGGDITPPKIVAIGLGAKNPTLDESKFPNTTFYYTPSIKAAAEIKTGAGKMFMAMSGSVRVLVTGTPEFLVKWNDEHELANGSFIMVDKNGVVVSQGYRLGLRGGVLKTTDVSGVKLKDNFKTYVAKGKEGKFKGKELKMKKSDFLLTNKIPAFDVTSATGETVSITSILESGEPVLLYFFQLDPTIDVKGGYKNATEEDVSKSAGNTAGSIVALENMKTAIAVEEELFGTKIDIMQ